MIQCAVGIRRHDRDSLANAQELGAGRRQRTGIFIAAQIPQLPRRNPQFLQYIWIVPQLVDIQQPGAAHRAGGFQIAARQQIEGIRPLGDHLLLLQIDTLRFQVQQRLTWIRHMRNTARSLIELLCARLIPPNCGTLRAGRHEIPGIGLVRIRDAPVAQRDIVPGLTKRDSGALFPAGQLRAQQNHHGADRLCIRHAVGADVSRVRLGLCRQNTCICVKQKRFCRARTGFER